MDNNLSNIFKMDEVPKGLLEIGERKYYRKNKNIFLSSGNYAEGLYYILRGRVAYIQYASSGQEKTFFIADEGTVFGEALLFIPAPNNIYMRFLEDTELLFFMKDKIFNLIKTDFDVSIYIFTSLSKKSMSLTIQTLELLFNDAETRICNFLLQLAEDYGVKDENIRKIDMKISQPRISSIVGVNRVTTVKIVKKLKELNLIELDNGYYIIKDLKHLKAYTNNLNSNEETTNTEQ